MLVCVRCKLEVESADAASASGWGAVRLADNACVAMCPDCLQGMRQLTILYCQGAPVNLEWGTGTPAPEAN